MFDQLKENGVCVITIQLVSVVEDKQPIKCVFTLLCDLLAGTGKVAVKALIRAGSVVVNTF